MRSLLKNEEELGHSLAEARSPVIGHDVDVACRCAYWHVTSNTGAGAVNMRCSGVCLLCEELTNEMISTKLSAVKTVLRTKDAG